MIPVSNALFPIRAILGQLFPPNALLVRIEPACESPIDTINVNAAQLNAIWCAACETAPIVPIRIPVIANAPASVPICRLLGTPIFSSVFNVDLLNRHSVFAGAINWRKVL